MLQCPSSHHALIQSTDLRAEQLHAIGSLYDVDSRGKTLRDKNGKLMYLMDMIHGAS